MIIQNYKEVKRIIDKKQYLKYDKDIKYKYKDITISLGFKEN